VNIAEGEERRRERKKWKEGKERITLIDWP
jgi:hypothetical protein